MDGLLVIDKPAGPTSHDVVARVRRVLHEQRIGHTGTLDPAASGVLPLVVGRATRLAKFLSATDKRYDAVVRFGVSTDTYDAAGTPTGAPSGLPVPTAAEIDAALEAFRGTFEQRPPAYSAKKIGGRRSYRLARRQAGAALLPESSDEPAVPALPAPATVTAHRIDVISVHGDLVTLHVDCSAGFYVRALAHDLGERLGTGAHLASLRRTASGGFTLAAARPLDEIEGSRAAALAALIPLGEMLPGLPAVVLTDEGRHRAAHGREIRVADVVGGTLPSAGSIRLMSHEGNLLGIAEPASTPGLLHPSVILM